MAEFKKLFCSFTANNFSKIIAELEAMQASLLLTFSSNKNLLQNVQAAFATNLETVKQEVAKLEARLTAVTSKAK